METILTLTKNNKSQVVMSHPFDLVDLIESPIEGVSKDDLPMFNAWERVGNERHSKNLLNLHHIILDYDNDYTIEEFERKYNIFNYYLYTSSSHTIEHHKFRVIIPLSIPLSIVRYDEFTRLALTMAFPKSDKTAFYKDHFFYIPSKKNDLYYSSYNNKGVNLNSVELYKKSRELESKFKIQQEIDNLKYLKRRENSGPIDVEKIEKIIEGKFNKIMMGGNKSGRYQEFLSLCGKYGFYNREFLINLFYESNYEHRIKLIPMLKNGRVVMRTNHSFVLGEVIDGVYRSEYKQPRIARLMKVKVTYTNGDTEVMLKKRLLEHTGLDNVLMKKYDKEYELYRFHYIYKIEKFTE